VIHFTALPERDLGAYANGYAAAARNLAQDFLSRGYADYEAYPVVFLYRHALELYLKDIIIKGLHLAAVRHQELLEQVTYDHTLSRLFKTAAVVLRHCFPDDEGLSEFIAGLDLATRDFARLDKSSFIFRYPVDKQGARPVSGTIHGSILAIARTMDPLLEQLDSVDTGLDVETDVAEEALSSYLDDMESYSD
jgi:hypothetical protein